ncbi:UNKNOWN [Stylonychia lemnae]|uniref:Uncharacterized protein n=1 Tax=Stylonychia lemnae TaxID=5949 RepID=A0A078A9H1_STYLE|nr:UNKNOWN [Stylonychia lemnae]|eukprot:CDW77438.1 UNKNOWN [Stylonychia lemnae]
MSNSLKLLQEIQNEIMKAKLIGQQNMNNNNNFQTSSSFPSSNADLNLSNSIDLNPQQMKSSFKKHMQQKENQKPTMQASQAIPSKHKNHNEFNDKYGIQSAETFKSDLQIDNSYNDTRADIYGGRQLNPSISVLNNYDINSFNGNVSNKAQGYQTIQVNEDTKQVYGNPNHNRYFSHQNYQDDQSNELMASPSFSQNHINSNVFDTNSLVSQNEYTLNSQKNLNVQMQQVNLNNNNNQNMSMKSDQLFSQLQNSLLGMKNELEKECDDITNKIDEIMRTELLTFDKIKDIDFGNNHFSNDFDSDEYDN